MLYKKFFFVFVFVLISTLPHAAFIPPSFMHEGDFSIEAPLKFQNFPSRNNLIVLTEDSEIAELTSYYLKQFQDNEFEFEDLDFESAYELIFNYPDLNDFKVFIEYAAGRYSNTAEYAKYATNRVAFAVVDSLVNSMQIKKSLLWLKKLSEDEQIYIKAKTLILQKKNDGLEALIKSLANDELKFALLNCFVSVHFPKPDIQTLAYFRFDEAKQSYVNFYSGYSLLNQKKYNLATAYLSKVSEEELLPAAVFMRGVALLHVNRDAAERDMIASINSPKTAAEQVEISRYMLAHIYVLNGKISDALMLLENCKGVYCRYLEAEANIKIGEYKLVFENLEGITAEQAMFLRAAAYYNLDNFTESHKITQKMTIKSNSLDHLRMLLYFRENNPNVARNIIQRHKDYPPLVYDAATEFWDLGNFREAYNLLVSQKGLPVDMQFLKARLLTKLGELQAAMNIYRALINSRPYESFIELLALQKGRDSQIKLINEILRDYPGDFSDKDLLLVRMAEISEQNKNLPLATKILNLFFAAYPNSKHIGNIYAVRAKMFYSTKRYSDCLQDISLAVGADKNLEKDLEPLKKSCSSK